MKDARPRRPVDFDEEDDAVERMLGLEGAPAVRHPGCPTIEMIQAADAEVLPDDERRAVLDHLDRCGVCGPLAAALREWDGPELDDEARARIAGRSRRASTPVSAGPLRWLLPIAAVAVLAVGLPALLREREARTPAPTTPATPRSFLLPLDKLPARMPPGLTVRGGDAFGPDLEAALRPYEEGDLEGAAARLAALAEKYPDAASARLYLGVSELLRGQPEAAEKSLEQARGLARELWMPDVLWYLAVARERAGRPAAARPELEKLCAGASSYRDRACGALERWPVHGPSL